MSPTPKMYSWTVSKSDDKNYSSSSSWGSSSRDKNASANYNWSSSSTTSGSSYFVNVGSSNNNESLPKFTDTFCGASGSSSFKQNSTNSGEFSWGSSSSRRNSNETLFGDPKQKVDWDGLVDNVFKEEIAKLSDSVQNKW